MKMLPPGPRRQSRPAPAPGVGAATSPVATSLTDAQTQLGVVSAYLTAAAGGTATAAQLSAAQTALVQAQADVQNALGSSASSLPPGTWIKGPAVVAISIGAGAVGGVAGWALRGMKSGTKKLKEKTR